MTILSYSKMFISGVQSTLTSAALACALGTGLGLSVALAKLGSGPLVRSCAEAYTVALRGIPELVVILLLYFGGTATISALAGRYVEVNAMAAGVAALTTVFGAYAAEIFRGAIQAIPAGQREAAAALGLSRLHTFALVIFPQMVPIALPAYGNLCISLIKDTSLISVVGLTDIMRVAFIGAGALHQPLNFYLAAAALYLVLTSLALLIFRFINDRFGRRVANR